jgi:hypothetical protein
MRVQRLIRSLSRPVHGKRGATLVFVAVAMGALFGFLALAIDLGMLFVAREDAQRAADAAALAGASAFLENQGAAAVVPANQRAMEYALRNTFQNGPIDSSEVTIQVLPESLRVGVWVQRDSVQTLFARTLGMRWMPIGAYAAAEAADAGSAKCLKPFALPDLWHDANDDTNGNRVWDGDEVWQFGNDPGDRYEPFSGPGGSATETGYGSGWRNYVTPVDFDYGRQIKIKVTDPNDLQGAEPSVFFPWRIPTGPDPEPCPGFGLAEGSTGAAVYRQNICSCNNSEISLGEEYQIETGNMVGPTWQGTRELIEQDPNAYWDESANTVVGSSYGAGWMNSPRVIKIALIDPMQITGPGMQTIRFNNFALMFIEEQQNNQSPVYARFLYYATGSGEGSGSLVKVLRLVK